MHADPAKPWRLTDLAKTAGMSRSSFAARFRETLGETPLEYLTRWRMMLAADRLAQGQATLAVVAPMVGYESESALGAAFKRVLGQSPRQFVKAITAEA
jgi:AraC-like DNA-binding protein